ncbi:BCL2 associated agonist of cell death, transcript variant X1 [Ictidomys tridecemlineatus]|uniref:bcl2-associated agonist of cell death isoform X1 n=2 Tax=Ictidomys tridecemlineatus TaxID=43179 RepID=UPI000681D823|nr:bcl2-associated agonist of cell death isoform X1 [Ictidomys tridecemlineatus]KAG3284777.1 BCL2 associated agonist of cell death, transcript variant X1 [Ictidomys tridecemlineatus]
MGIPEKALIASTHAPGARKSGRPERKEGPGRKAVGPAGRRRGWHPAWSSSASGPNRDSFRELIGPAQSMFQIPEFEPSEQEDSSSAEGGLGPSPAGDRPGPYKNQPPGCGLAPGLPRDTGHQQWQATSSSNHGGAGATETRSRHSSYPADTDLDEGMEEEPSPFRGRSRSAPPNLWAAQRYGRELRRMSDEFEGSFKGLPRPRSAGTASQMRQSSSWTRFIQSWWDRNLGRRGSAPSQ